MNSRRNKFFQKVFGSKKDDNTPTTGRLIQNLRETEILLIKIQEILLDKIAQEIITAKENASKNRKGNEIKTLLFLKIKNYCVNLK